MPKLCRVFHEIGAGVKPVVHICAYSNAQGMQIHISEKQKTYPSPVTLTCKLCRVTLVVASVDWEIRSMAANSRCKASKEMLCSHQMRGCWHGNNERQPE